MKREAITEKELLEMLRDDEFELTTIFTIKTPSSKEVPFIKLEVLDKIKTEIKEVINVNKVIGSNNSKAQNIGLMWVLEVIDKHIGVKNEKETC